MCRVAALCLALLIYGTAISAEITGRVVGIQDDDTITVLDANHTQYKIRLLGIDAPEAKQAFGTRSKQHLSHLVYDQQVRVEYNKRDYFWRPLGKVYGIAPCLVAPCPFAIDVNLAQVQAGMAWWDTLPVVGTLTRLHLAAEFRQNSNSPWTRSGLLVHNVTHRYCGLFLSNELAMRDSDNAPNIASVLAPARSRTLESTRFRPVGRKGVSQHSRAHSCPVYSTGYNFPTCRAVQLPPTVVI